ncbi:MAG TPA: FISUMP domain-containing protein, partial [Tenuifilaceae bacterium]|nr:FISUMP domain-containing protein [Tenuifilaceae bacterium]
AQSFIFDGAEWQVLSKDGLPAENGEPGSSIEWLGMLETAPAEPVINQAYHNATDGNSYIFDGTQWSLLATKGEVGTTTELPAGTAGNFIIHDGTDWLPTGRIRNSDNSVVVSREAASATDAPIFAVYNSAGELVFAVHEGGTRVYVSETAKAGSKGGFAVGGLTQSKGEENYLTIMPDSVRFGIVEGAKSGSKGGFAVGGLTQNKYTPTQTYISMAYDSVRFTVVDNELKGSKGGFAVGGLTQSKEEPTDLFNLNADTTYITTTIAAQSDVVAEAAVTIAGPIVTAPVKDIDGNIYSTVDIGTQRWMASNLKVTRYRDGTPIATGLSQVEWQDTTIGVYTIYDSGLTDVPTDSAMNAMYGKLYNGYAVVNSLGLCPAGWVVPNIEDWEAMIEYLGGNSLAGGAVKSIRTDPVPHPRWNMPNAGATNLSGFRGLPAGGYIPYVDGYMDFGNFAYWHASTIDGGSIYYYNVNSSSADMLWSIDQMSNGLSVRCIKTDAMPPKITTNPVTDISFNVAKGGGNLTDDGGAAIDSLGIVWGPMSIPSLENNIGVALGRIDDTYFNIPIDKLEPDSTYYYRAFAANKAGVSYGAIVSFNTIDYPNCGDIDHLGITYKTVRIGDQCWMRENLRATTFRGGEPLEPGSWTDIETIGGYWDESIDNTNYIVEYYGYNYNWAAAKNDNICPAGWYMPEASDWQILIDFLDGEVVAGGKLKGTRIYDMQNPDSHPYWYEPNLDATNESGFSAYPAGSAWSGAKSKMGSFFGEQAYFWSKTEGADMGAFLLQLTSSS